MKISLMPNINPLNFKSSRRALMYDKNTKEKFSTTASNKPQGCDVVFSNFTYFFRGDFMESCSKNCWSSFSRLVDKQFKDCEKVNFYDFGCSDGSEAYTIIMTLKEKLGEEKSKKFFPIYAFDTDSVVLKSAKSGIVDATFDDAKEIYYATSDVDKYFFVEKNSDSNKDYPYKLKAKDSLKDSVCFNKGDFLAELDNIEGKNSIIFCRNFWPYLTYKQRDLAARKLAEKLDDSSIVVIGAFDGSKASAPLYREGFMEVAMNVFKKNRKGFI